MDAFLLGAGFSKAISDHMPTAADLLPTVREVVAARGREELMHGDALIIEDLEGFLSLLASRHPGFTDAENAEDLGLFERVTDRLGTVIDQRTRSAVRQPIPGWLESLVRAWHRDRVDVLTFNYDTLVEAAVATLELEVEEGQAFPQDLYAVAIELARAKGQLILDAHDPRRAALTFQLVKMHGSVNWHYPGLHVYAPPIDAEGYGRFGQVGPPFLGTRWTGGLRPMIVPPTTSKSPYFDNATMTRIWLKARIALEACDTLYAIGYSFPQADTQVAALLAATLAGERVVVVNPDPEVAERVRVLLRHTVVDDRYCGMPTCVDRFVDEWAS